MLGDQEKRGGDGLGLGLGRGMGGEHGGRDASSGSRPVKVGSKGTRNTATERGCEL